MLALAVIACCAILNRLRGDNRWMPAWLHGRALWYVAPALGLVALSVQPWPKAAALALAYLLWAVPSWGYLLAGLGGFRPERSPSALEAALLVLPGTLLPVFVRMLFIAPGLALVAWLEGDRTILLLAPAFAAAATTIYALLFRPMHALDWTRAEIATGALWGVVILLA